MEPDTRAIIRRIRAAAANYGTVWKQDSAVLAMQKYFDALGLSMPRVSVAPNLSCAYRIVGSVPHLDRYEHKWLTAYMRLSARMRTMPRADAVAWGNGHGGVFEIATNAPPFEFKVVMTTQLPIRFVTRALTALNSDRVDDDALRYAKTQLNLLDALEAGVGFFFPLDDQLILVPSPAFHLTANRDLHSETTKAIRWADGNGYYFLRGVGFPEKLWRKLVSRSMRFQDIIALRNFGQRTVAIRYSEIRSFLEHNRAEKLDTYNKVRPDASIVSYELWRIFRSRFITHSHYMVYNCPSTSKLYMSGVPEHCTTVPAAMAWKFSTDEKSWKRLVPMVTES